MPLAFPAALVIAAVLHESIGPAQVAPFLVGAMLYITLARGRLIGSSVMIHERQYPRVFAIVKHACATLEIPMPLIFAREDNYVPVAALGFGEPYALIISSHWIEEFEDDELAFMIGRELGHIAAGHTRYLSLLSVNGRENPLVAILFGAWLRRCTFTCDKVGLLVWRLIRSGIARDRRRRVPRVRPQSRYDRICREQAREIASDSVLRWGTWLGSEPMRPRASRSLQRFMDSHAYTVNEEWVPPRAPSKNRPHSRHPAPPKSTSRIVPVGGAVSPPTRSTRSSWWRSCNRSGCKRSR